MWEGSVLKEVRKHKKSSKRFGTRLKLCKFSSPNETSEFHLVSILCILRLFPNKWMNRINVNGRRLLFSQKCSKILFRIIVVKSRGEGAEAPPAPPSLFKHCLSLVYKAGHNWPGLIWHYDFNANISSYPSYLRFRAVIKFFGDFGVNLRDSIHNNAKFSSKIRIWRTPGPLCALCVVRSLPRRSTCTSWGASNRFSIWLTLNF